MPPAMPEGLKLCMNIWLINQLKELPGRYYVLTVLLKFVYNLFVYLCFVNNSSSNICEWVFNVVTLREVFIFQ